MKFKIAFVLLVFSGVWVFAQKKEMYVNDNLEEISLEEFNKKETYRTYHLEVEIDSMIIHAKVIAQKKGKLSKSLLDTVRSELSSISGKTIPDNHLIVINYYHGKDRCNSSADSYGRKRMNGYNRRIQRVKNVSQFFMYKSPEGLEKYGKKLTWIKDKYDTIRRLFLRLPYPCGSFVLIDSYGDFYASRGEYNLDTIIELIKDKKTTFARNP